MTSDHPEAIASEMINEFGKDAKRQVIHQLVDALGKANKSEEVLMREVFHHIMLNEQNSAGRSLLHTR